MKKRVYYPPEDIKDMAPIYESEIDEKNIYLYRRVPEKEIQYYYKRTELDRDGRLLLFVINTNKKDNIDRIIGGYWEAIRKLIKY